MRITKAKHHAKHSDRQFLPKQTCLRKKNQFYKGIGDLPKPRKRYIAELVTES